MRQVMMCILYLGIPVNSHVYITRVIKDVCIVMTNYLLALYASGQFLYFRVFFFYSRYTRIYLWGIYTLFYTPFFRPIFLLQDRIHTHINIIIYNFLRIRYTNLYNVTLYLIFVSVPILVKKIIIICDIQVSSY